MNTESNLNAWPSKDGLGAIVSYGVKGNGVVCVERNLSDVDVRVDFPRVEGEDKLHKFGGIKLVESQMPLYSLNSRIYNKFEDEVTRYATKTGHQKQKMHDSDTYVPKNVLKSYLAESNSLSSDIAYDPTFGNLFSINEIRTRNGKTSTKIMAFVTGERGTIFNISPLNYTRIEVKDEDGKEGDIHAPSILKPFQVEFPEPIKQIEMSDKLFGFIPSYILIRTASKVHILRCYKAGEFSASQVELELINDVSIGNLEGEEFADVAFNPQDFTQFCIIDIMGNLGLWQIKRGKKDGIQRVHLFIEAKGLENRIEKRPITPSIYNPAELSNWKKIVWGNDNTLIAFSRSGASQFRKEPLVSSKKLITSNSWSRILDIVPVDRFIFLLTTKELLWLESFNGLKRILSWKHFLDSKDPSLHLHVNREDDSFTCIIYSQLHPVLFVYTFELRQKKPYSVRDPYMLRRTEGNVGLQQVKILKLDRQLYSSSVQVIDEEDIVEESDFEEDSFPRIYCLFELTKALSLSANFLSLTDNLNLSEDGMTLEDRRARKSRSNEHSKERVPSKIFSKFAKSNFSNVWDKFIRELTPIAPNEREIAAIQDYAFKLGEASINIREEQPSDNHKVNKQWYSLLDLSDALPSHLTNLQEYDSMVEQLSTYYSERAINLLNEQSTYFKNSNYFDKLYGTNICPKDVHNLYAFVRDTFGRDTNNKNNQRSETMTALMLGSSLTRVEPKGLAELYKDSFEKEFKEAPDNVKDILEDWDLDPQEMEKDSPITQSSKSQSTLKDLSSFPSINISSQNNPSQNSKQKKRSQRIIKSAHNFRNLENSSNVIESQSRSRSQVSSQESSQLRTQKISQLQSRASDSQRHFGDSQGRSLMSQNSQGSQKRVKKRRKGGFA